MPKFLFLGTAIDIPVMPALAAELSVHMKEKAKPDLSRIVMSSISGLVNNVSVKVGDIVAENTGEELNFRYLIYYQLNFTFSSCDVR